MKSNVLKMLVWTIASLLALISPELSAQTTYAKTIFIDGKTVTYADGTPNIP